MAVPECTSEAVAAHPNGSLRQYVAVHHGYRQRGVTPAEHLGMPSPYLTVIFTLGAPLEVTRHPDPRQRPETYRALIGGLHRSPALVAHHGAQSGIQLQMSPLAARPLLGLPAGEVASLDVRAEEILGPLALEISDRVRAAGDWPARFAVLDRMLGRAAVGGRSVPDKVAHAWDLLLRTGGQLPIREVAREVGWSQRHLSTTFAREIGLRPKTAARVVRFDRARRIFARNVGAGRANIADVAAECGYFDQAHLVRDWQDFTGLVPTAWIAHEFQNFQATLSGRPASSIA